jgi:hypothetical protein
MTVEAGGGSPTRPGSAYVGWGLFVAGLLAFAGSFALRLADGRPTQIADITGPMGFLAIGVAGLAIATRKPENAVGWL